MFKKDPFDLSRVTDEVDPKNAWALTEGVATRKFDGTACAIIGGELYRRYDAKNSKPAPVGGIPCQDADPITGHWPHWVKCDQNNPSDRWALEAFGTLLNSGDSRRTGMPMDGTYELCGPKIGGNREGLDSHQLIRHGIEVIEQVDTSFRGLKDFLFYHDIEGIVFHHWDGRMCKIRKSDFGFNRKRKVLSA